MSWLYLPELVEGFSEASSSDGAPSVQLSLTPTASRSSSNDNGMDCLNPSPSGTMSRPSTGDPGLDWWMSSRLGGLVRTSAVPPQQAPDSRENGQVCGVRSLASWLTFDLDTVCWRTRQYSILGGLEKFCGIWPRWGIQHDGECWELDMPGHLIEETGPGLWPTPTKRDWKSGKASPETHDRNARPLSEAVGRDTPGYLNPDWVEGYLMGWPIGWTSLEPIGWGDWWDQTWWDDEPCPRITTIKTNRVNRLKAIGNGQVPACVVMAWELLT